MIDATHGVIAHRCDRFVARTMNWLYDHLLSVPRYQQLIICNQLENRDEFPELEAVEVASYSKSRAIWRRLSGRDVDPFISFRLKRRSPLVLHSHFGYVAVDDHGLWQGLGVPWVVGFYGADVYALGRLAEWRTRYHTLFQACSKVLALGPFMSDRLAHLGCPPDKINVHPLGVDIRELPDEPRCLRRSEPLRCLFAGTFREKKGIAFVLNAVATAREEGVPVELHLVAEACTKPGDVETQTQALQLIEELRISDFVFRYPFQSFRDLLALALRSHVFVGPSVTAADGDAEGTPFVLQQMMATSMPVIATRHTDIPYVFGELSNLLVPERDSDAIAARLVQYARSPAVMTEHGRLFRERIVQAFDVRQCGSRLSEIYGTLT